MHEKSCLRAAVRTALALPVRRLARRLPLLALLVPGPGSRQRRRAGAAAVPAGDLAGFSSFDVGLWASPKLADLDGDGDLDAVAGSFDGGIRFFANVRAASSPFSRSGPEPRIRSPLCRSSMPPARSWPTSTATAISICWSATRPAGCAFRKYGQRGGRRFRRAVRGGQSVCRPRYRRGEQPAAGGSRRRRRSRRGGRRKPWRPFLFPQHGQRLRSRLRRPERLGQSLCRHRRGDHQRAGARRRRWRRRPRRGGQR